jgi:hypothetical protein
MEIIEVTNPYNRFRSFLYTSKKDNTDLTYKLFEMIMALEGFQMKQIGEFDKEK